jgi:hypothetical protein
MLRNLVPALGLVLLAAVPAPADKNLDDLWIHVAVDGSDQDPERVRVNLPLGLLESVLPLIEEDEFHHGKIRLDDGDLEHDDVVAILRAVAEAKDGEYVTVEDGPDHVRVAKKGDQVLVRVEERHGDGDTEHVDIRIPVKVLDALVSAGEDEIDVIAAVQALGEHGKGDLVTVNDEDGTLVRIWVDESNESD